MRTCIQHAVLDFIMIHQQPLSLFNHQALRSQSLSVITKYLYPSLVSPQPSFSSFMQPQDSSNSFDIQTSHSVPLCLLVISSPPSCTSKSYKCNVPFSGNLHTLLSFPIFCRLKLSSQLVSHTAKNTEQISVLYLLLLASSCSKHTKSWENKIHKYV